MGGIPREYNESWLDDNVMCTRLLWIAFLMFFFCTYIFILHEPPLGIQWSIYTHELGHFSSSCVTYTPATEHVFILEPSVYHTIDLSLICRTLVCQSCRRVIITRKVWQRAYPILFLEQFFCLICTLVLKMTIFTKKVGYIKINLKKIYFRRDI